MAWKSDILPLAFYRYLGYISMPPFNTPFVVFLFWPMSTTMDSWRLSENGMIWFSERY